MYPLSPNSIRKKKAVLTLLFFSAHRFYLILPLAITTYLLSGMLSLPCQSAEMKWFKGNVHAHSNRAPGGDTSTEEVIQWYFDHQYDFIAITDHDQPPLKTMIKKNGKHQMLVIPGTEISIERQHHIHMNALNLKAPIIYNPDAEDSEKWKAFSRALLIKYPERKDIRRMLYLLKNRSRIENVMQQIRSGGGVAVLNHPSVAFSANEVKKIRGLNLFELMSPAHGDYLSENMWDQLLTSKRRLYGLAVDDAHLFKTYDHPEQVQLNDPYDDFTYKDILVPGTRWIWAKTEELTPEAIMAAIENGNFYATNGIQLKTLDFSKSAELKIEVQPEPGVLYFIEFIGAKGRILKSVEGKKATYIPRGDEIYIRGKITNSKKKIAFIQPVFLN
ncbi:MAG: hypothetical protein A3G33_09705 [Omnitrophica bacterium RIFCSPLOWO2_12_FULL_44_17]|uniref:Polymerase/histidinol phosphatase N-terminal domain-containing protein n=1 Tax=Candidatus Danuiimicrobium aquiferis TaxID=1801832 RepID=A0A1G1KWZ4_9BACT|nr:MAG: hypothetical protein A3B72_09655 [Omnitrophica bacterium RIFCSPHIGHO2_02_FULL_45_28]OGW89826.1 MAG: hypothetical protein A3E74_02640 [Omnitrophica bacterium RIFCSPHIGHO2_12_FULL_44_12]OGW97454.1 MAG: hypothetical protein A3G33_09705 [Omnitrophica bacterium RIFCSPLOWO2_12_FULL_44_17]OGX04527.1 MAG: hypothetical protein A3J12_10745 [Omnitrophica bacterium RIFCSPLOWO2_02_FULL_44_11]